MSFFFPGGSKQKPQYTGIQLQTASAVTPVPLVWGKTRVAPNIIWHGDFKTHKKKQKSGKGGPKQVSYTYSASVMLALCEGEITSIDRVFKDKEKHTSYAALGFSLFVGSDPQAAWGYLTTKHPTQAFNYPGVAYLAAANYDLGQSASLPQHSFEVMGRRYDTDGLGQGDAAPWLVVEDFLRDPKIGAIGPTDMIDESTLYAGPNATTTGDASYETYCRVMGFGLSPALVGQEEAGGVLERWAMLTNTEIVWTGYSLKLVPYGTDTITANGYTYKPDVKIPIYTIDASSMIASGADPMLINRTDPADADNALKLEFRDRDKEYNSQPVEWKDQALIDQFGLRPGSTVQADEIVRKDMAGTVVTLIGTRKAYIRNRYDFTLGPEFILIEPTDVLIVTDPELGPVEVLVEQFSETDEGNFSITAREHKASVSSAYAGVFTPQGNTAIVINAAVAPSNANVPIIFEPPKSITGDQPQVWAAVSGGDGTNDDPNWGGAVVFISSDNVTFQAVGEVDTPARMGTIPTAVAATAVANPVAGPIRVNLAQSNGDLTTVTADEALNGITLSYLDGELISYRDATLVAENVYDLGSIHRGLHGTAKAAHAVGTKFARLDESIFKYDLPPEYVGKQLWFKFQSYNIFGTSYQDISTLPSHTFTPAGIGFGVVPGAPTTVVATSGILSNKITWVAPTTGDAPVGYRIHAAEGTGIAFAATTVVGAVDVSVKEFMHSGLDVSEVWTYYVVAYNGGGDGAPSASAEATTSASGGGSGDGGGGGSAITATSTGPSGVVSNGKTSSRYWRIRSLTEDGGENYISLSNVEFREVVGVAQQATGGGSISSGDLGGYPKENAFDGNDNTTWISSNTLPNHIGYYFATTRIVKEVLIRNRHDGYHYQAPKSFEVQHSTDGVTWVTEWTEAGPISWNNSLSTKFFLNPKSDVASEEFYPTTLEALNDVTLGALTDGYALRYNAATQQWKAAPLGDALGTPHRYWRLFAITNGNDSFTGMKELYFLDSNGADIAPTGGTPIAIGGASANAFDRDSATHWEVGQSANAWIGYDFGVGQTRAVAGVKIMTSLYNEQTPETFRIEWSNDNITWNTEWAVAVPQNAWANLEVRTFLKPAKDYRVGWFATGALGASEVLIIHPFTKAVTFPANFLGSVAKVDGLAPGATLTIDIQKNNVSVGSLAISTGGVATFTSTGGNAVGFAVGDRIKLIGPATVNSATDISGTFEGAY